ncbi:hypothetical protein [Streptomyces lycii]|uniref:hypothetical protein n=1 Tax=Streptomyces lycii TaxID=2654337 RepID=UPI001F181E63|nr:hypothetical protein [Streptomyces lycii]
MGGRRAGAGIGPGGAGALSRRRLLGMSGAAGPAALGVAGCGDDGPGPGRDEPERDGEQGGDRVTAPPPVGVLGANFNGDPSELAYAELEDIGATWLRGFYPVRDTGGTAVGDQPQIKTLLAARERGYGTVLSLKFPYNERPLPAPGSSGMKTALARLDEVLPVVMGKTDILVIGNEPFLECRPADRGDRLNAFYEQLARHVIDHRDRRSATGTRLYMGALNHLDRPGGRTPATRRWLDFVRKTPAIAGVDIHPHLSAPGGARRYLEYVLPALRDDQTFLATEFSLVLLWKEHLGDPVSAKFAARYEEHRGQRVWQVIKAALDGPFTQQKWDRFLSMSPWFDRHRTYLRDQVEQFRGTGKLAVAAYGVSQDADMASGFGVDSTPWLLNSLFCPYTVLPGKEGLPGRNRAWTDGFRSAQQR